MAAPEKKSYSDKLKDPRWQRMRLEVLDRDGFKCTYCHDDTTTLHVHHTHYEYGKDPWQYDPTTLRTLCERCHTAEEVAKADLPQIVGLLLVDGFLNLDLCNILSSMFRLKSEMQPEVISSRLIKFIKEGMPNY